MRGFDAPSRGDVHPSSDTGIDLVDAHAGTILRALHPLDKTAGAMGAADYA